MQKIRQIITILGFLMVVNLPVYAQHGYISEEKALAVFETSSKSLKNNASVQPVESSNKTTPTSTEETFFEDTNAHISSTDTKNTLKKIKDVKKEKTASVKQNTFSLTAVDGADVLRLEDAPVALDVENRTLKDVLDVIMNQARPHTGMWDVKWRLSAENKYLMKEQVNLTAETNFGEFVEFLVDRINNMTGVKLFVTVFNQSRIIVISDTYY